MVPSARLFTQGLNIIHFAVNWAHNSERSEAEKDASGLVQIRLAAFPLSTNFIAEKNWANLMQYGF